MRRERIVNAMQRLALPIFEACSFHRSVFVEEFSRCLQGAFSTLLGVLVLSFVRYYVVNTFFKNVFLVIVFGLFHALVLLPMLFDTIIPLLEKYDNY